MLADNLFVCVFITLIAISGGTWLVKVSFAVDDLRHRSNIETLGIVLLFASWLPTTNAAWITSAVCDQRIRETLAKIQRESESQIATQISEPAYVSTVAEWKTRDGHSVTVSLPNGGRTMPGRAERSRQPAVKSGRYPVSIASGYAGTAAVFGGKLSLSSGANGTVSIGRDGKAGTRLQETF